LKKQPPSVKFAAANKDVTHVNMHCLEFRLIRNPRYPTPVGAAPEAHARSRNFSAVRAGVTA
jgi:hypothetical protein